MAETFLIAAILSIALSLALTPAVMMLARKVGAVDIPDKRKIHSKPMPRMGGLAVFASFVTTLIVLNEMSPGTGLQGHGGPHGWLIAAISLLIIVMLGICDDIWTLPPGQKFLVQFIAGFLVWLAGFRIDSITNPFSRGTISLGFLSIPFTVFWVVGITNAFNLIDGLDGLASGIAMIAALTISAIGLMHHDLTTALIAVTLGGAVLGFLKYNFNPAKVFLGDTGSLVLGFTLAVLSIQSSTKGTTAFSMIIPLLALGVPIMDTTLAMMRRILRSFLPDQSQSPSLLRKLHGMFLPDRQHIHHQLLAYGLSHREAVFTLYVVSCAFGLCAFLVTAGSLNASLMLVGVGALTVIAVRKLGYREMAVIRNGLLLRLYRKAFMKNVLAQIVLDVVSVLGAFLLTFTLTSDIIDAPLWRSLAFAMITVAFVQLLAFLFGGLYRRKILLLGLGDILQILKAVFVGAVAASIVSSLLPMVHDTWYFVLFTILDFYLVATFVVGSRVGFHALNYVFRRESTEGKKALIYGADRGGLITLQALLAGESIGSDGGPVVPVGFLDDDPGMEGSFVDGYPVFGGHWKLEGLVNKMGIGEIVFAHQAVNPEVYARVRKIADDHKLSVSVSNIIREPVDRSHGMRPEKGIDDLGKDGLRPRAA